MEMESIDSPAVEFKLQRMDQFLDSRKIRFWNSFIYKKMQEIITIYSNLNSYCLVKEKIKQISFFV